MSTASSADQIVRHFVARAKQLYSLPAVAMRVLELTGEPTVDTQALTECIEQDPALTTKILRVVNSSMFGLSRRVSNLKQALALLGTRPLKMLVLGFSLPTDLASATSAEILSRYWRHTLFKAVAAREIAEICYNQPGDDAFLAGLLQDLGLLVLVQDLGESYEKFLLNVWSQGEDLAAQEIQVLGFCHTLLSARLLEHWKLPEPLVESVGAPWEVEQLTADGAHPLAQILHLAELVTLFLIERHPRRLDSLLRAGERYRNLSLPQLQALMSTLEQKAPQLADVLSLQLPGDASYSTLLLDAYRRLAEVSDDVTAELLASSRRPGELLLGPLCRPQGCPASSPPGDPPAHDPRNELRESASQTGRQLLPPENSADLQTTRIGRAIAEVQSTGDRVKQGLGTCGWSTREGLIGRVSAAVAKSRQTRAPLSLILIELDHIDDVRFHCGVDNLPNLAKELSATVRDVTEGAGRICQLGDARFAIVLEGHDRGRAVAIGWRAVEAVRHWTRRSTTLSTTLSVSIGLATLTMPPRNFPAEEMLTAAERCLTGVQLSGGDGVKSIDIF